MVTSDYNTPTKADLDFKGSFIKKSEERARASRVDEREVENRQEPVTQYDDRDLEPICVLKIELDDEIVEHIKIF